MSAITEQLLAVGRARYSPLTNYLRELNLDTAIFPSASASKPKRPRIEHDHLLEFADQSTSQLMTFNVLHVFTHQDRFMATVTIYILSLDVRYNR